MNEKSDYMYIENNKLDDMNNNKTNQILEEENNEWMSSTIDLQTMAYYAKCQTFNHPNMIKIDDLQIKNGSIEYISTPQVNETLKDYLQARESGDGMMNPELARRWCGQLLDVVYYLHQNTKIIHGAIELDNIFIVDENLILGLCAQQEKTLKYDVLKFWECVDALSLACQMILQPSEPTTLVDLFQTKFFYKKPSVILYSVGSRGDVVPFAALGEELIRRGYHVLFFTLTEFKTTVENLGMECGEIDVKSEEFMSLMISDSVLDVKFIANAYVGFRKIINRILTCMYDRLSAQSSLDFDFKYMIAHAGFALGSHFAEYLNIPLIHLMTMPWTPTSEIPHATVPNAVFYRLSYVAYQNGTSFSTRDIVNDFRVSKLHLPAIGLGKADYFSANFVHRNRKIPFLYTWSASILPKPSDWESNTKLCGFLLPATELQALLCDDITPEALYSSDSELNAFMARASKPLYIGFGSVDAPEDTIRNIARHALRSVHLMVCAASETKQETKTFFEHVIIQVKTDRDLKIWQEELNNAQNMCTERFVEDSFFKFDEPPLLMKNDSQNDVPIWSWLTPGHKDSIDSEKAATLWENLKSNTILIRYAHHSVLFRKCGVVVHHGGLGTFSTCSLSGTPQIIVPFFMDQYLWGFCISRIGNGNTIPSKEFNSVRFIEALYYCVSQQATEKAEYLKKQLQVEMTNQNPVQAALHAIDRWVQSDTDEFDVNYSPDYRKKTFREINWKSFYKELNEKEEEGITKTKNAKSSRTCTGPDCVLQ